MIYIICCELKQPSSAYKDLYEALKNEGSWAHYMGSMWFIDTEKDARDLFNTIKGYLSKGDRVLVSRLPDDHWGMLPRRAWDWIKRHGEIEPI
jgi:hypothetical protein